MSLTPPSRIAWLMSLGLTLSACGDRQGETIPLALPERPSSTYITDQLSIAGLHLALRDDNGGCRLQIGQEEKHAWLKPMAPCYFIRSPGSDRVQIYQENKTTRVIAIVGTPAGSPRCGQEVQGLIIDHRGQITLSDYIMRGSKQCSDKGLQNFQYELFTKPHRS